MKIELGKKYKTRNGIITRIICTDKDREFPVVALIQFSEGEIIQTYKSDGTHIGNTKYDLISEYTEPLRAEFECVWKRAGDWHYPFGKSNTDWSNYSLGVFVGKRTKVIVTEIVE